MVRHSKNKEKRKIKEIKPPSPKCILTKSQKEDPVIEKFLDKFERYLLNTLFVSEGSKIAVAVSGGVDSCTMLDALALISEKMKYKLFVLHFNHRLRGKNADGDEAFVRELASAYGLSFYSAGENVLEYSRKNSLSIEHAARRLRYGFFEKIAKSLNLGFIATAHSSDDSAETFLMNLLRGSGITGLSGIPRRRMMTKKICVIRPFLSFSKAEIKEFAGKRDLNWHEDESNSLLFYTRNKIRHELIPYLQKEFSPAITVLLNRTSGLLEGADELIGRLVEKRLKSLIAEKSEAGLSVKISVLQTHSEFFQGEIIQRALKDKFGLSALDMNAVDAILNLTYSQTGSVYEIGNKFIVLKDRENLIFARRVVPPKFNIPIEKNGEFKVGSCTIRLSEVTKKEVVFDENPNIEFFDSDSLPPNLLLRNWEQGDYFQPLGMKGKMKLSDFLTNEKFSLLDKQNLILLASNKDIVWVCGKRTNENFKVKKNSRNIIKAEFIRN